VILDPIKVSLEVGPPTLHKDVKEQIFEVATDSLALQKVVPDPRFINWVQLRSGLMFHFSREIDSVGSVTIEGSGVIVNQVKLGTDQVLVSFGGETPWDSMLIWIGGFVITLPLWFIYFVQSWAARRENLEFRHETGPIGGGIQLYFAGAFSFMPLTSDVEVPSANEKQRSRIALYGLYPPAILSLLIWFVWQNTGDARALFLSDAFLIFPMVQCFPLSPLEGIYVWRYNKLLWLCTFCFIMSLFMIVASAGLKGVI
jgi:hypothetical protein